jgi:lipopolysaccharide export LptBFGC system permease protein LptF
MKTEMDILNMDDKQRMCWLLANRSTLIIVGIFWIGMIASEFAQGRIPVFLTVMVPVFAAVRFGLYLYYKKRS